MKKLLLLIIMFMVGCGPSLQQLEGEKAFYAMLQSKVNNPMVKIKIADPTLPANIESIEVWSPEKNIAQYQHVNYAAPWISLVQSALSIGMPWLGAALIVGQVKDMSSSDSYQYNQNVSGQSTGTMRVGSTTPTSAIYGNSNSVTGYHEAVSEPTVVKPEVVYQPEPLVVNPTVVNPVVVQ